MSFIDNELVVGVGAIVIGAGIVGAVRAVTNMFVALKAGQTSLKDGQTDLGKAVSAGFARVDLAHADFCGRMNTLAQWKESHEESDAAQFTRLEENARKLEESLRDELRDVRGRSL